MASGSRDNRQRVAHRAEPVTAIEAAFAFATPCGHFPPISTRRQYPPERSARSTWCANGTRPRARDWSSMSRRTPCRRNCVHRARRFGRRSRGVTVYSAKSVLPLQLCDPSRRFRSLPVLGGCVDLKSRSGADSGVHSNDFSRYFHRPKPVPAAESGGDALASRLARLATLTARLGQRGEDRSADSGAFVAAHWMGRSPPKMIEDSWDLDHPVVMPCGV